MTLAEVIASGRPFRRPTWTHGDWLVVHKYPEQNPYGGGELWFLKADEFTALSYLSDLLAEDWELRSGEEEPYPHHDEYGELCGVKGRESPSVGSSDVTPVKEDRKSINEILLNIPMERLEQILEEVKKEDPWVFEETKPLATMQPSFKTESPLKSCDTTAVLRDEGKANDSTTVLPKCGLCGEVGQYTPKKYLGILVDVYSCPQFFCSSTWMSQTESDRMDEAALKLTTESGSAKGAESKEK